MDKTTMIGEDGVIYCANQDAPAIRVAHSSLKRWGDESAYKSECPACDGGILLVYRDLGGLRRHDRCIKCAQLVVYTDDTINGERVLDV